MPVPSARGGECEIIIIMIAESNVSIRDFFQNVNLARCTNEIAINSLDSFSPVWAILIQQMLPFLDQIFEIGQGVLSLRLKSPSRNFLCKYL